jgi:hypothetical protein
MENEKEVKFYKAPIRKVMVYPYKARITRKTELEVEKGVSVIAISDLPRNLNRDSVKANITDDSGVIVKSVNLKEYFEKKVSNEELEQLEKDIKDLNRELAFIENELNRLAKEFTDIKTAPITPPTTNQHSHPVSFQLNTKSWDNYLSHVVTKLGQNRSESRELMLKAINLKKNIIQKEQEKSNLKFYLTKKTFGAEVIIQANQKTKATLQLNYLINNASWFPVYDLRVSLDKEQAEIITYAVVKQGTGEDWTDVNLEFSTASPSVGTDIVKLRSWRIKRQDAEIIQSENLSNNDLNLKMPSQTVNQGATEQRKDMPAMKKKRAEKKISLKQEKKQALFDQIQQESGDYEKEYMESADYDNEASQQISSSFSKSMKSKGGEDVFMGGSKRGRSKNRGFTESSIAQQSFQQQMKSNYHSMLNQYFMDDFRFDISSFGRKTTHLKAKSYHTVNVDKASGGYDYRFSSVNKETVLSINEPYQVELKRDVKEIDLIDTTIPVEKASVFMKALYKNESDAPMLSGSVRVFIDTDYIGDSFIRTVSPGEVVSFSLGVENDIKVLRREKSKRETSGFISKSTVVRFEVEFELISYKDKPVKIDLYDRIPLSRQSDDINVYDEDYSIQPSSKTPRGILRWDIELKKGEAKKVTYAYKVKHPEDFQLVLNQDIIPYREGE